MKLFKKDLSPLKLNDSDFKNSYLEEIKRKINIERIVVNIEINEGTTEDNCVFSVNGGFFHDKWDNEFKEIQLNILFNAGEKDVTKNLDTFVLRLKDLVAHEITHNEQNNQNSMEDDVELFYNELNNIMMLPVTICLDDLFDIYQNDEKVEAQKLLFFIDKLTEETLKFKHRILIYIEQHYRNVQISQDKIWVNIDNIKSYIKDKMNERFYGRYAQG